MRKKLVLLAALVVAGTTALGIGSPALAAGGPSGHVAAVTAPCTGWSMC